MSYTLFSSVTRTAKKEHRCIWCGQKILAGKQYTDERSLYDGKIQRLRWQAECLSCAQQHFHATGEGEFQPWDNERPSLENTQVSHDDRHS